MNIPEVVVVFCTAPDELIAKNLTSKVLSKRLAACVTLFPRSTSFYYWESRLKKQNEVQMFLKTDVVHQDSLLDFLKSSHPYRIPELLVLEVAKSDDEYRSWINLSLR